MKQSGFLNRCSISGGSDALFEFSREFSRVSGVAYEEKQEVRDLMRQVSQARVSVGGT